ncbi:MAG: glycosyltransferase family 2 protein [Ilumatobacteraceae bacterium]
MPGPDVAPRLSVVIPVRDRPDALVAAVGSIISDWAGPEVEVIVVDDGSSDDTADRANAIGDHRVSVLSIPPSGVTAARNHGVQHARASFVSFLDSDDVVLPGWVEAMVTAADRGLDLFSCADIERHDQRGDTVLEPSPLGSAFGGLTGRYQPGTFGVSRSAFLDAGGYMPGLRFGENTVLWMELGRLHLREPLTTDWTRTPLVVVHRRDRPYDAALMYESGVKTFERVGDMLGRDRRQRADHLAITGVAASRLGHRREALGLLARAVRARPFPPVNSLRWFRALVGR